MAMAVFIPPTLCERLTDPARLADRPLWSAPRSSDRLKPDFRGGPQIAATWRSRVLSQMRHRRRRGRHGNRGPDDHCAIVVRAPHSANPVAIFLAGCRECLPEWEIQVGGWPQV